MRRFLLLLLTASLIAITGALAADNSPVPPSVSADFVGHPSCAGVNFERPSTPECDALIASRPTPNVSRMGTDFGIIENISLIRFTKDEVNVYDSPGGARVESVTSGYTYIRPLAYQDGWAQIGRGRWISLEDARFAQPSSFSGVMINGGLDMPFAWVLWGHNPTNVPNGERDRSQRLERYQLVNIYATVNVRGWNWYLIGPNMWTNMQNLSLVFPGAPASFGGNWVGVNLYEQNLVAYSNNAPVMATLVSSGLKNGQWDTRKGTFSVGVRVESGRMSGSEGLPDFYSLDLVPYSQYFDGLISLHGTYWHDSFGYPQSHGCVNLSVSDAKWLYSFIGEGSTVHVYD